MTQKPNNPGWPSKKTRKKSGKRRKQNVPKPKKNNIFLGIGTVFLSLFLAGCTNMPTPPAQITGSYTSGLEYEQYDCAVLAKELASLARRESSLVIAQEQRIKSSEKQAFWFGYGQGDGIEAAELANVKGEKEAVRKAMDFKSCRESAN